ncbi:MAG TPA: prepilin-type N-terminal cleavage/methylation domain-containing protein [Chthoniobacterales bacterium]|jgi:prepilin-type N-terminal cleavage/methylation domain-containing protein|nr:prepilin-type N-terminal cleavage/methylation domain-containing protein [Chthoniobacterales bacterium]
MKRTTGQQSGFTLIELTLVVSVSVMIATALVGMLNLHLQTMNQAAQYRFVAKDAPFIGLLMTKTIGNAEDYRIFASRANAVAGTPAAPAVLTGPAVRLWMRQPNSTSTNIDQTYREAILSFESIGGSQGIYFFLAGNNGTFPTAPSWELAGVPLTAATFEATSGVLLVTLNGSYGDQYTFAAEKK